MNNKIEHPIVIIISGKAHHGKDTLARNLKNQLEEHGGYSVAIIAYADYLKHIAKNHFGWNGEKDDAGRALLQELGDETRNTRYEHFWVMPVMNFIMSFKDKFNVFIITDARYKNEVEVPKTIFGNVITIRVTRRGFESGLTQEQKAHISEIDLDDYEFDINCLIEEGKAKEYADGLYDYMNKAGYL